MAKALDYSGEIEQAPHRIGDVYKTRADISKAEQAFGWTPRYSFEDGLKETVAYFKEAYVSTH